MVSSFRLFSVLMLYFYNDITSLSNNLNVLANERNNGIFLSCIYFTWVHKAFKFEIFKERKTREMFLQQSVS